MKINEGRSQAVAEAVKLGPTLSEITRLLDLAPQLRQNIHYEHAQQHFIFHQEDAGWVLFFLPTTVAVQGLADPRRQGCQREGLVQQINAGIESTIVNQC